MLSITKVKRQIFVNRKMWKQMCKNRRKEGLKALKHYKCSKKLLGKINRTGIKICQKQQMVLIREKWWIKVWFWQNLKLHKRVILSLKRKIKCLWTKIFNIHNVTNTIAFKKSIWSNLRKITNLFRQLNKQRNFN